MAKKAKRKLKFSDDEIQKKLKTIVFKLSISDVMENLERQRNFKEGQALVVRDFNGTLEKNGAGAVQKYIVTNVTDRGLVICRKLGISGRPGKGMHIIADFNPLHVRFEEDPDVADATLLDYEYDPLEIPKTMGKVRRIKEKHNSAILLKSAVCEFINDKSGYNASADDTLRYINHMLKNGNFNIWVLDYDDNKLPLTIRAAMTIEEYRRIINDPSLRRSCPVTVDLYKNDGSTISEDLWAMTFSSGFRNRYYIEEPLTTEEVLLKVGK